MITNDGRHFLGTLKGFDQSANIILTDSRERMYRPDGVEDIPAGLQIVRGDNV